MHPLLCLFPDPDQLSSNQSFIARLPKELWRRWGSSLHDFNSEQFVSAYLSDNDDGLGLAMILESKTENEESFLDMIGLFPVIVDGASVELELLAHDEDQVLNGSGTLSVITVRHRQLDISDPDYLEHRHLLRDNAHYRVELCGWVINAQKQPESFDITDGPALERERDRRQQQEPGFNPATLDSLTFSMSNFRNLLPKDEPGWYEFITRIEKLRQIRFDGMLGWCFEGQVEHEDDDKPALRVAFAMMEHAGQDGYIPMEGDLISGVVFLQGLLKEVIPYEGLSWADRPGESDMLFADIMASLAIGERFTRTPPALSVTARIIAGNGWEVTSPPYWSGSPEFHPLVLLAQRGEDEYLVGLEVNGDVAPTCDITLPISCLVQGDGHEVKIDPTHPSAKLLRLELCQLWAKDNPDDNRQE